MKNNKKKGSLHTRNKERIASKSGKKLLPIDSHIQELANKINQGKKHVMKRCFMTGKQCIFSSQITESVERSEKEKCLKETSAFVIMPFQANLETFYRWSLKPYLIKGYRFQENNVQRADEVREIGYIVCEKICKKIQETDLVIAEVTRKNSNVFYELGLSIGLEKPYILLQDAQSPNPALADDSLRRSLNIPDDWNKDEKKIMKYPSVGALDIHVEKHRLPQYITFPSINSQASRKLVISILKIKEPNETSHNDDTPLNDIKIKFNDILKGSIGVALAEIRSDIELKVANYGSWQQVVKEIPEREWFEFSEAKLIEIDDQSQGKGFDAISKTIESSFATVIDVSHNNPVAYFWLGYCHARGLNAIPVYKVDSTNKNEKDLIAYLELEHGDAQGTDTIPVFKTECQSNFKNDEKSKHDLAFDIHALWYAQYDEEKPYEFKTKIREIFEHLLQRDLPDRQKRAFWNRFPAERKMKVFTGAIHVDKLNREMIGDWDLRTVSELFSFLPSVREAMAIELVTPIYSPEQAFKKYKENTLKSNKTIKAERPDKWLNGYREYIEKQLKGSNAIVIASPDVNPITEYLLHKIYHVTQPPQVFEKTLEANFNGFVVVKQVDKNVQNHNRKNFQSLKSEQNFSKLFYHEVTGEQLKKEFGKSYRNKPKDLRGFGIHAEGTLTMKTELFEKYVSQDECKRDFSLLGHLVVARYPQSDDGNMVVLLNGVSGPATYALAQILTGGGQKGSNELNAPSEHLLQEINKLLDSEDCPGIEAIIKVQIKPTKDWKNQTYLDSRQVKSWNFLIRTLDKRKQNQYIDRFGPKYLPRLMGQISQLKKS